ncbi:NAD(P)-binding protein [Aureobasidium sp. EXF-10728]|nr:NAD(P)-binding protein [Aureobasidium sp. EXF-10728]
MVKIAIAGGTGNVGSEIIDVLLATEKHEVSILSRKEPPPGNVSKGITWIQVDYQSHTQLTQALDGVHTLLSFISEQDDPGSPLQKNIIRAAVDVGVKRFAPSEWASSGVGGHLSWYSYKGEIRRYLKEEVNKHDQVLEYTLFQPGYFLNYLTSPYKSSKYLQQMQTPFDFDEGRFIMIDGSDDDRITLTTVQDLAQVVARAVEYEGKWPVVGGISGVELSMKQIIELGEKIRGKPFKVERIPIDELKDGSWKSTWSPKIDHPSIPPQKDDQLSRYMVSGILQAISAGDLVSSDEWNKLLPDFKFVQPEEFLASVWAGKP